jgi:uncharacterized protein DUF6682
MKTGTDIITEAGIVLQDTAHVRWPVTELVRWINDGQRAIVLAKPSASAQSVVLSLQEGTLQTLSDASHLQLLRIPRNISAEGPPRAGGRVMRPTTREMLDAGSPGWHDRSVFRYTREPRQYVYDEENPREYYVFPGNDGQGKVEAVVSVLPTMFTFTTAEPSAYNTTIGLPEPYGPAILDYVLYRALSKDDIAADLTRAMAHYRAFAEAVGIKIQTERVTSPNTRAGISA